MNFKNIYLLIFLLFLLLTACGTALYVPTQTDADQTGIPADSLMMGRKLYVDHCGSCHNLYLPEKFTKQHWLKELPEMRQKAKISEQEARLIRNFILARSKQE
jgi:mono/diheme cytochrome c family protein